MTVNNDIGRRRAHITDMRVVLFFFSASQKKREQVNCFKWRQQRLD